MSLLRRTRAEVAGAIRSLRYDLGRHPVPPPADGPDMTSTGMSTFGGVPPAEEPPTGHVPGRAPRRALAVTAFGLLTVVGAGGAYVGVVKGLGSVVTERPAAADAFPLRPSVTSNARIGEGPAAPAPRTTTTAAPAVAGAVPAPAGTTPATAVPPPLSATTPVRGAPGPTRTKSPTSPECKCEPPVPTPTAPSSSPSPTPSASPSDPAEPSDPAPSESSATPDDSAAPSEGPHQRRRHRG